ncbi:NADP-dependent oxidoreductase [Polaribacter reichenbachii]|uniref:NADP-dependent oxidoreductase n=1 Tax=Polaribacter reichenbachii TaxID=996801 RepID=A0A1B8U1S1_9FLAO|nr:NADP-dependent oxidoreductase [Polaribacter reichenbachii]APZ47305.1 NADP-dependent oxidoreductase [Polaribacter reichenbachii]AUC17946.1 NADP-dependent oxidoreductase [Polaribacter reichenbachii]OBY65729.1 NADP-dependent oxidoreductase [Polaribacter reichenbachii]
MKNKQIIFKKRPVGVPDLDTWQLENNEIPELKEGEVLIQQHYISLDPAMRGWMNDSKSYIPPVAIDDVMRAGSIGTIIKNNGNENFAIGDVVSGWGGVQQFVNTKGDNWYKVDTNLAPMPVYIGTLGMPGMTAYFGITEVGKIKEGDTVLISGAAGAVGSIVGQIAKIKGCTVIGIAGGKEKCDYLINELGFDKAIDYKSENIYTALKEKCSDGVDIYFDNVGGTILDAALTKLKMNARVVLCGAISQYNKKSKIEGPSNYLSLLFTRSTMQGMVVMDYAAKFGEAAQQMGTWMQEGKLKSKEDIYDGIENFQETYNRLFSGDKKGKLILKVIEE